ncbi:Tetratricopeptide repeat-containing protein [Granulicella rosea]|uniref:Tetratricopeptide repeat-containing protein n=1 Tax=Granulicella rosea TaxID=474952 RepID=A0A239DV41_9BACT|nr:tetratricopeptide repeat protein [Granulicella rosea]SNS36109.1 Tetratricopeptide repeat-containing protein [Granulicella rosea]
MADRQASRPATTAGSSRNRWLLFALLLATLLAYANSFDNAFHFDDFHTVTDNPAIRRLSNVPRFFADAGTFSVLPANRTYRPLVSASLALDYALGHGYVPFWFHLTTFLWFLLLLGCLFLWYETLFARAAGEAQAGVALLTTAWFGLHPAMAETVNYVIQRGDLFCTLGCVTGLLAYARRPHLRRTGAYLLPLVAALLCKPPAAVFPVLLLFYVFFFEAPEGRGRWRTSALAMLPSLTVTAAALCLQSAMTPKSFAPSILSPWEYRMTQPWVWLRYFGALFLPLHLNVDSDLAPFHAWNAQAALGFAFVALLAAAIVATSRRRRWYPVAYGLIWFVATQLPTSVYALSEVENDHRMFFSFAGLVPAVAWTLWLGLQHALGPSSLQRPRPALVALAVLALGGYAWGVHARNRVWSTEETLWLDDVQKSPHNGRGLMIYGLTQMNKGAYAQALRYFNDAAQYTPNYATLEINLGVVCGAMNRAAEAERHFQRAISLAPEDDQGHAFYGRWLLAQNRLAEAIAEERKAIALNPARPMERELLLAAQQAPRAHAGELVDRSLSLNQAGRFEESIAAARAALEADPGSAVAWNNIAANYEAMHRWDEAIDAARRALALKPDFQLAKNNLAWSESQKRLNVHAR